MDWHSSVEPILGLFSKLVFSGEPSRRVAAVAWKGVARACLEPLPVQILVVVANTRVRTLRTEVGEGFHVNSVCTWVSRSLANGEILARRDFKSHAMDERLSG
ncbi:hypothetical protein NPIL_94451 [Nephila pilipes]|uniref:Uncharacterized protein n=1 Tax=Nephila pilipes TaxID=299642 RepID=A0A8X6TJ15_NEPPI|nr:hypothetical protein NPIL_94451 [Nephila pilipes]